MAHTHSHTANPENARMGLAISLTLTFVVGEGIAGYLSHSLALNVLFPRGIYSGRSDWKNSKGEKSQKNEWLRFDGKELHLGVEESVNDLTLTEESNGFFNVIRAEKKAGTGYCISNFCHYEFHFSGGSTEESFWLQKDRIYNSGSHRVANGDVKEVWAGEMIKK